MVTDAMGNEIIIGNRYGYGRNVNGFTYINAGKAIKAGGVKVTLELDYAKKCLYEDSFTDNLNQAGKVSVRSFILFPII